MPNDIQPGPEEEKKQLEIDKLRLENVRLEFEKRKLTKINADDEAEFQKQKQNLELGKLNAEKEKLETELANLKLTRGFPSLLPLFSSMIALLLSFASVALTVATSITQMKKTEIDEQLDQDKGFRETLEKATDEHGNRRAAFVWTLNSFWNTTHATELANAIGTMFDKAEENEIALACSDSLGSAYNAIKADAQRETLNEVLFGKSRNKNGPLPDRGVVGRSLDNLSALPQGADQIKMRKLKRDCLTFVISKNLSHLRNCDFSGFTLSDLTGKSAIFAGSDFSQARLNGMKIERADFSNCELQGVQLERAWLLHAKFLRSDLANANFRGSNLNYADFTGSNLLDADFTGATVDGAILSRTNLKNPAGLSKDLVDAAFRSGAVSMNSDDFDRWNIENLVPNDPHEYSRWQQDGFQVDEAGRPVFAENKSPEHGLFRAYPSYFPND
jgi:hypothetical protein